MASLLTPITANSAGIDLSARIVGNNTITASPSGSTDTVVGTIPAIQSAVVVTSGIFINFMVSYTVATSGTAVTYRIRQGTTAGAGTVIYTCGAVTSGIAAGNLVTESISGFDASPGALPGQAYCLTMAVTAGSGASTVSALSAFAIII